MTFYHQDDQFGNRIGLNSTGELRRLDLRNLAKSVLSDVNPIYKALFSCGACCKL